MQQDEMMVQVELRNNQTGGREVAWVPYRKGMEAGKEVQVKPDNTWHKITKYWPAQIAASVIQRQQQHTKSHRKGSDI
jgi:hypothetical protein